MRAMILGLGPPTQPVTVPSRPCPTLVLLVYEGRKPSTAVSDFYSLSNGMLFDECGLLLGTTYYTIKYR
jgi:hypothetical protein